MPRPDSKIKTYRDFLGQPEAPTGPAPSTDEPTSPVIAECTMGLPYVPPLPVNESGQPDVYIQRAMPLLQSAMIEVGASSTSGNARAFKAKQLIVQAIELLQCG